jgi:indole-3-glycerol phosphate synthase
MKQNARKQQVESILKYAMEKGLQIPAEIAKTPELHRITYVGSKILADQLVFSSL